MNKKGFSTLEASFLMILCVAAGLAMFVYLKGAIQGNWKTNADSFSDEQYEAGVSTGTTAPALVFKGSKIVAKLKDGSDQPVYSVGASGTKQVPGWGTYEGEASDEDE